MNARNNAIVKQLIDWKADLEASNQFGWTAMYCAAFGNEGQTKIRMLSEAKADVNAKTR